MEQTALIVIKGTVQGVFFRQSTLEQALKLGIRGTVRNLPDGSVEVLATAPAEQLKQFADWCRKGPTKAEVDNFDMTIVPTQHFESFTIIG